MTNITFCDEYQCSSTTTNCTSCQKGYGIYQNKCLSNDDLKWIDRGKTFYKVFTWISYAIFIFWLLSWSATFLNSNMFIVIHANQIILNLCLL